MKEANALGTAYLRADTIAEPRRGELKAALREYTADRVILLSCEGRNQIEPLLAKVSGLHQRMWRSAIGGHSGQGAIDGGSLLLINEVIRSAFNAPRYGEKTSARSGSMTVLLGTAAIGVGLLGFGNGRASRRFSVLDFVYGAVLAVALWMTIDLDYPGIGIIRVSNLSVVETLAAMK